MGVDVGGILLKQAVDESHILTDHDFRNGGGSKDPSAVAGFGVQPFSLVSLVSLSDAVLLAYPAVASGRYRLR